MVKIDRIDTRKFAFRLKEIRSEKFSTMEDFCTIFNKVTGESLNKGTVSRWEKGEREPFMSYVQLLAEFFCVPVAWLMGISDVRVDSTDEEDAELLEIFHGLSIRGRAKLLAFACELEEDANAKR